MENILVALDGSKESECVLPYVAAIARGFDSRVTLMNAVYHPISNLLGEEPVDWQFIEEFESSSDKWAKEYLQIKQAELHALNVEASWSIVRGSPADAIIDFAHDNNPDLIAMSTHGRSGLSRMILGSVTQRVLQACSSPLLLKRPSDDDSGPVAELTEIMIPLDSSELAESVLPLALDISKRLGLLVHVVAAIPSEADLYLGIEYMVHPSDLIEQAERAMTGYIEQVAQKLGSEGRVKIDWEILHGDAGREIVEHAKERPNNLIAMSTHGRSGLGRWILGSVTDKVVRSSGDPVIVVRPKD